MKCLTYYITGLKMANRGIYFQRLTAAVTPEQRNGTMTDDCLWIHFKSRSLLIVILKILLKQEMGIKKSLTKVHSTGEVYKMESFVTSVKVLQSRKKAYNKLRKLL